MLEAVEERAREPFVRGEQLVRDVVVRVEHDLQVRRRKALEQPEELDRRPEDVLDVRLEREDRAARARRRRRARRATLRATPTPPVACSPASRPNRLRVTACRSRSRPPTCRRAAPARGSARGSRDPRAWSRRRARRGCDTRRARRSRFRRRRAARRRLHASGRSRHSSSSGPPSCSAVSPKRPHVSIARSHSPRPNSYVKIAEPRPLAALRAAAATDRAKERSRADELARARAASRARSSRRSRSRRAPSRSRRSPPGRGRRQSPTVDAHVLEVDAPDRAGRARGSRSRCPSPRATTLARSK